MTQEPCPLSPEDIEMILQQIAEDIEGIQLTEEGSAEIAGLDVQTSSRSTCGDLSIRHGADDPEA